jgi:mRNA-degrading endonuclease RelE of RelBE toxin-antitoxin system
MRRQCNQRFKIARWAPIHFEPAVGVTRPATSERLKRAQTSSGSHSFWPFFEHRGSIEADGRAQAEDDRRGDRARDRRSPNRRRAADGRGPRVAGRSRGRDGPRSGAPARNRNRRPALNFEVFLAKCALRDLAKVPRADREAIRARVLELSNFPNCAGDVRKLQGAEGLFRLRVGDWRAFFTVDKVARRVIVTRVANRKDAY